MEHGCDMKRTKPEDAKIHERSEDFVSSVAVEKFWSSTWMRWMKLMKRMRWKCCREESFGCRRHNRRHFSPLFKAVVRSCPQFFREPWVVSEVWVAFGGTISQPPVLCWQARERTPRRQRMMWKIKRNKKVKKAPPLIQTTDIRMDACRMHLMSKFVRSFKAQWKRWKPKPTSQLH